MVFSSKTNCTVSCGTCVCVQTGAKDVSSYNCLSVMLICLNNIFLNTNAAFACRYDENLCLKFKVAREDITVNSFC